MKKFFLIMLLAASSASAAKLEDVSILSTADVKDGLELKLHASTGPQDSYFFVTIVKTDVNSFKNLTLVTRKLDRPKEFKLNLIIPSFSMSPSGSTYRSEGLKFWGTDMTE